MAQKSKIDQMQDSVNQSLLRKGYDQKNMQDVNHYERKQDGHPTGTGAPSAPPETGVSTSSDPEEAARQAKAAEAANQ